VGVKLQALLTSRRFYAVAFGVINLLYGDYVPVLDTLATQGDALLTTLLTGWVVGDSLRKTD
jgi:hypothetical protein